MKLISMLIILICMVSVVSADTVLPIHVKPLSGGAIQPNTAFNYTFNFTRNADCSDVLVNNNETITTNNVGDGFVETNMTLLEIPPKHVCEYKDHILRAVHNLSIGLYSDIWAYGKVVVDDNITSNGTICDKNGCIGHGNSSLNIFDQTLNTSSNVSFANVTTGLIKIGNFTYDGTAGLIHNAVASFYPFKLSDAIAPNTGIYFNLTSGEFQFNYLGNGLWDLDTDGNQTIRGEAWFDKKIIPSDEGLVWFDFLGKDLPMFTMNDTVLLGTLFGGELPTVQETHDWGMWSNTEYLSLDIWGLTGIVDEINLLSGRMKLKGNVEVEGGLNTNGTAVMFRPIHLDNSVLTFDMEDIGATAKLNSTRLTSDSNLSQINDGLYNESMVDFMIIGDKRFNFSWTENKSVKMIRIWWRTICGADNFTIYYRNSTGDMSPIVDYYGNSTVRELNYTEVTSFANPEFLSRDDWISVIGYYFPPQLYEVYTDIETDLIMLFEAGGSCNTPYGFDKCGIQEVDIYSWKNYINSTTASFDYLRQGVKIGDFNYTGNAGFIGPSTDFCAFGTTAASGACLNFNISKYRYSFSYIGDLWWLNVLTGDMNVTSGDVIAENFKTRGNISNPQKGTVLIDDSLNATGNITGKIITSEGNSAHGNAGLQGIFNAIGMDINVNIGDIIGEYYFKALDSSERTGAIIRAKATATWGSAILDAPTVLEFYVQNDIFDEDGLATPKMTINESYVKIFGDLIANENIYANCIESFYHLEWHDQTASIISGFVPMSGNLVHADYNGHPILVNSTITSLMVINNNVIDCPTSLYSYDIIVNNVSMNVNYTLADASRTTTNYTMDIDVNRSDYVAIAMINAGSCNTVLDDTIFAMGLKGRCD